MIGPKTYRPFGIYLKPRFLGPKACAAIHREMARAARTPAKILKNGQRFKNSGRRTSVVDVGDQAKASLRAKFEALRPVLSREFGVKLRGMENSQFLLYHAGDLIVAHQDRADYAGNYASRRRVSVVLFLSRKGAAKKGAYLGGELIFHGKGTAPAGRFALGVDASPGLLAAFDSDIIHEVTAVQSGERCTIVTWYY